MPENEYDITITRIINSIHSLCVCNQIGLLLLLNFQLRGKLMKEKNEIKCNNYTFQSFIDCNNHVSALFKSTFT